MNFAGKAAGFGNKLLSIIAALLVLVMLAYGGYSLWNNYLVSNAFISDELLKFKPVELTDEIAKVPTFDDLRAINPEVAAWITVDDTHIDYPVLQNEYDMYYVNHDVYGDFSISGSIFLSCQNSFDFSDSYNVVYGHHMDNGAMFGDVTEFLDEDFYNTHKTGELFCDGEIYDLEIFACVRCDAYDKVIYHIGPEVNFRDVLDYTEKMALYYDKAIADTSEKIIALSTCSDSTTNGRVLVFAKMVRR